jgi:hypothetical protein
MLSTFGVIKLLQSVFYLTRMDFKTGYDYFEKQNITIIDIELYIYVKKILDLSCDLVI